MERTGSIQWTNQKPPLTLLLRSRFMESVHATAKPYPADWKCHHINGGFALSHHFHCWRRVLFKGRRLYSFKQTFKLQPKKFWDFSRNQSETLTELDRNRDDKLPTMNVEFISLASFIVMSIVTFCVINTYLVVLSMQSRPAPLAVPIPVLPRMDDQRAFMVTRRVGNRPVPQENDEWLCWESKRAQFFWFSLSNSTDMPYPLFSN